MFGGHGGGGGGQQAQPIDTTALARQQSEAQASQRALQRKRYGRQATRITDPIVDLANSRPNRTSMLGGGEAPGG
jgi:hypothetical protein